MAEVLINFAPQGDDEVLDAIKKVTRHINDLKRIAKTPIDLNIAKGSMLVDDFNRLKHTINKAKDSTRDWAKETTRLWREQEKLATAAEKAARAMARNNPVMGGITGSMMGAGKDIPLPLGNASSMPVDPKMFSTKAVDAMKKSLGEMGNAAKGAGFQLGFVTRIIAAMGIRAAVREVFSLADAYTTLQNKLKVTVGADSVGFISKEIFKIAQESRTSLESVTTAFSRTTRSVKALGKSQQEVLTFTGALSKAIQIGGSTSMEASNAMIQLSQGMGSGALRGDELRSVLEQLPIVAELIADKMGVPISALRKLGAAGQITTDVIFDAISGKSEELSEKMKTMQLTVGQAWTMLKNQATMSSAAMQGVMNGLANAIQFVTNHFEEFVTAALMLASAMTAGGLIKAIIAATEASKALRLVWTNHPLALAAGVIAVVVAALIPLVSQLKISSDATATFGDVWSATWEEVKATFEGDGVADGIKTVDGAVIGLADSTKEWMLNTAAAFDIFTSSVPVINTIKGLLAEATGAESLTMITDKVKRIIDRTDQNANADETDRLINQNKELLAEDMSFDGGISEEDRLMKEFEKEREGLLAYAKILADKERKAGGKNPSGQTFAELMQDLNKDLEKTRLTTDLSDNSIPARIAQGWIDAVDKLEDKIAGGLTEAQSELINKTLEEKILIDEMLKAQEKIQKMMEERAKAERKALEEYSEKYKKFAEEQRKSVLDFQESRADRQTGRFDDFKNIAGTLDPNMKIKEQIVELEKFKQMAKENNLADWAKLAKDRIDELKASMRWENTHFETFADQMKSIFGPGGTLVKGFADAAANAIVMSESLSDLRRALVDVLNSVQKQALSALIQLPMNLAIGALTNSITGGGAGATNLSGGARSVSAAEASSWGFSSGGYTGNGGIHQPAGIVHGQEFVLNADATRRMGKQNLEMINKGGTPVSGQSAPANITINNNAGVQVEANQVSPGQIEIMITKAIQGQVPRLTASQINDPNSLVARSLQKNISSERRRI